MDIEIEEGTLTWFLLDQCNLNDSCHRRLIELEEQLYIRLANQSLSKQECVSLVKSFCRSNSGPGFYDIHGRAQVVVEGWWEAMDNHIKMNDLEDQYDLYTPSPEIRRLEEAAREVQQITNSFGIKSY